MAYMDRIRELIPGQVRGLFQAFDLDVLVPEFVPEEQVDVAARIAAEEGTIRTAIDLLHDRVGNRYAHYVATSDVAIVAAAIGLYMLELVDDIDVDAVVRERVAAIVRAARDVEPAC